MPRVINANSLPRDKAGKLIIPPGAVYIGRPSKWGNPFKIGRDDTRLDVISKFQDHVLSNPDLYFALPELRGKDLVCWCSPAACHGDVLLELANG